MELLPVLVVVQHPFFDDRFNTQDQRIKIIFLLNLFSSHVTTECQQRLQVLTHALTHCHQILLHSFNKLLLNVHQLVVHLSLSIQVHVVEEEHEIFHHVEAFASSLHQVVQMLYREVLLSLALSRVVLVLADDPHQLKEPIEIVQLWKGCRACQSPIKIPLRFE